MARGYPDYQNPVNQVAGRLVDFSGIQTAILGLATLDGLGRLVWFDKFHDGVSAWELLTQGGTIIPVINSAISEIPPSCLKFPVAGKPGGEGCSIMRGFQFTDPKTVGCETAFLFNRTDVLLLLIIYCIAHGTIRSMSVRYYALTGEIQLGHAGGWTTIVTLADSTFARLWIPIKLVVDFENGVGRRLLVGIDSFSIASYSTPSAASVDTDQIYIKVQDLNMGPGVIDQYLGHVYLTMDEP